MSPSPGTPLPSGGAGSAKAPPPKGLTTSSAPKTSEEAPLASGTDEETPSSTSSAGPLASDGAVGSKKGASSDEKEAGEEEGEEGEDEEEEEEEEEKEEGAKPPARPARTAEESRKAVSRFILFFMGFMGLYMMIDQSARNSIAITLGFLLAPALGFSGRYILATMFLTAALEMGLSALAYHFTTDWIETATVQHHGAAIRPLWMKAVRAQKKDHMEVLKPHMDQLNVRQSKVTIAQLKGMVITWVLLIAIYTWMGLFIAAQCPHPAVNAAWTEVPTSTAKPFILNASISDGWAPFTYSWWMQGASSTGVTENMTGPTGPSATSWTFQAPAAGAYLVTLQVVDARGSVGWGYAGLQYQSNNAPPGAPAQSLQCKGSEVLLFGANANLLAQLGPFPLWFLAFSLYTVPINLIFRRYLKHIALTQKLTTVEETENPPKEPLPPGGGTP